MFRAILKAPSGVVAVFVLVLIVVVAIVAPFFFSEQATVLNVTNANKLPSPEHLLGTDSLGRDIFARLLVGTRLSIGLAFLAALLGAALGMVMGVGAVLLRGRGRMVALRVIDAFIAFPNILVAIFIGAIIGPGILGIIIGVGVTVSFSYARVTSSLSLSIIERDFISAARISGIGQLRLMIRYILPNIGETLAINTTVQISNSITAVSTLSFLGLGVQPPDFDWGQMLTDGVRAFYTTPAAALGPAVAIAVSAIAFGFAGEAIARASNPVLWAQRSGETPRKKSEEGATPAVATIVHPDSPLPPPDKDSVLEVRDLSVSFPSGQGSFLVVDGVSFTLRRGERLGIVGESGSGKTTTALAIAELVAHPGKVTGRAYLEGREILKGDRDDPELKKLLGTTVAIVYQDPLSSLNPALRIGRQMTEATEELRNTSAKEAHATALERLAEVNIPGAGLQLERYPHEFSGGMRQRVMIAMGLMMEPSLFICDEPTTALDVTVQAQIMDLLAELNAEHGSAIILISHSLALVAQNTDRVLVMYAGRVVEDLNSEQLLEGGHHPYTRQLLAAIPDMSRPREDRLEFIPGQAPDPAKLPTGCPYSPRCPLAFDKCRVERPPLTIQEDGRRVACWAVEEGLPVESVAKGVLG